ncbi:36962_t:CDS:1, partial [Racocetra persica]
FCKGYNQFRLVESFLKNNKLEKTCSKCRDKKNRQNVQKRAATDAQAPLGYGVMDNFLDILKTMK